MEDINRKLNQCYEDLLGGEDGESVFPVINEILKLHPDGIDLFIEKFYKETNKSNKETLAEIILRRRHYQPVIDFLENEMGWDDFTGFAGFPDS